MLMSNALEHDNRAVRADPIEDVTCHGRLFLSAALNQNEMLLSFAHRASNLRVTAAALRGLTCHCFHFGPVFMWTR